MEEITLEKIDALRERTGISYAEAKEILERNNGNLIDSLIFVEKNHKTFAQNISSASNDLVDTVKDIINKGNVSRIKIKKDNRLLVDIPVTAGIAAGAIGGILSPYLLIIGTIAAVASKVTIEVERPDGRVDVVNKVMEDTYDNLKNKVEEAKDRAVEFVNDVKDGMNSKKSEDNNTDNNSSCGCEGSQDKFNE